MQGTLQHSYDIATTDRVYLAERLPGEPTDYSELMNPGTIIVYSGAAPIWKLPRSCPEPFHVGGCI